MLKCDYQLNALLECINIYSDLNSDLQLKSDDVKRLSDYIKTQNKKIEELKKLAIMYDKELTNMTKEVEEINL
jgi:hypothetical protein